MKALHRWGWGEAEDTKRTQEGAWENGIGSARHSGCYKHLAISAYGQVHPPHGGRIWTHLWSRCRW